MVKKLIAKFEELNLCLEKIALIFMENAIFIVAAYFWFSFWNRLNIVHERGHYASINVELHKISIFNLYTNIFFFCFATSKIQIYYMSF